MRPEQLQYGGVPVPYTASWSAEDEGFYVANCRTAWGREAISVRHCPSLKRDVAAGEVMIRQVTRWRPQMAIMTPKYTAGIAGRATRAVGHAKVQLIAWIDRDMAWLDAA